MTVILSDMMVREGQQQHAEEDMSAADRGEVRELITGVDEYQRLADSTGGLLIPTDKFDVSDVVNIMGGGVETSTVTPSLCALFCQ